MNEHHIGFIAFENSIEVLEKNSGWKGWMGGVTVYQNNLAKYLINNGNFYVKILNINSGGEFKILKKHKYEIISTNRKKFKHEFINIPYSHFIEPFYNALLATKLLKDVDIFHFNNFVDAGLMKLVDSETRVIYTVHGRLLPRNSLYYLSPYYKIEDRFSLIKMKNSVKHSDALITVDSTMDKELYQFAKKYNKRIFLIPNGVDINKFSPKVSGEHVREKYNIPDDAVVIISTSRFAYQRRIEMVIKAFAKLNKEFDNIYLLLVGDGPRKNELIQLAKDLKIEKNIVFTGAIPNWDLPNYYAAADIAFNSFTDVPAVDSVIHTPSLQNSIEKVHTISINFSTIEALASGLPVIAVVKKVYGYRNIDEEYMMKDCGILIPSDDLEALTNTLKTLINRPSLRVQMSLNAREIAVKKRNIHSTMKKTLKVYEYALSS